MEEAAERMAIACVHCAKAKAKCDKKVPCSRCVGKRLVCTARETRRSSHNPSKRNGTSQPHPERALITSTGTFSISQLSKFGEPSPDISNFSPSHPQYIPPVPSLPTEFANHAMNLPDNHHQHPNIAPAQYHQPPEMEQQPMHGPFIQTPPDLTIPITPMLPNMPHMEPFVQLTQDGFDQMGDTNFLAMNAQSNFMEFDPNSFHISDLHSAPNFPDHQTEPFMSMNQQAKLMQTPQQMHLPLHDPSMTGHKSNPGLGLDTGSPLQYHNDLHVPRSRPQARGTTPSTASSSNHSGLQEPGAVLAAYQSWPFFQCNRCDPFGITPKSAHIYLEGLSQTLRNQATWQTWSSQIDPHSIDVPREPKIIMEPIVGWSREKLLAITQSFLYKALDIHKTDRTDREHSPASPGSSRDMFLMLPPPDVMQYFLRSYAVRYEPYYSSLPGGRLDPNELMHLPNSKAASLLLLLMVASGASATATVEGRYVASGLTEACRISLFDLIEKDVMQSRDPMVLRAALLFICQAAWSGDKWHMDMAMGQRGTYLAMLAHAGLLEKSENQTAVEACRRQPERAWDAWKQEESRHRLAHAWITLDQEISLFSDTTPLLSIVNLHTPMPESDDLWHASSSTEWLEVFNKTYGESYQCPGSLRDFFTCFVNGDFAGQMLSPTQLRLLLHPLQAQVCHLRQFIACLPDGGKSSQSVSKAATKARLEEISSLLQHWYSIMKRSFSGNPGTCWTTCANIIMYHLVSLNTITSFKDIEQFARKEVVFGSVRPAAWLQMRCIDAPEEVYVHCGQILRMIVSMPYGIRPPWWAGAVYRVALSAWATSMANAGNDRLFGGGPSTASPVGGAQQPFAIDRLTPETAVLARYIQHKEGTPMLTRLDNTQAPLDVPANILTHCIELLEQDSSMRIADGIKRKLMAFAQTWRDC